MLKQVFTLIFGACVLLGSLGCSLGRPVVLPVVGSDGLVDGVWDDLDVYLIDPATGQTRRLTDTPGLMETDPAVNMDRSHVVYVARAVTDGQPVFRAQSEGLPDSGSAWAGPDNIPSALTVVDVEGLARRVVYRGVGLILSPTWSNKGDRIAFTELVDGRMRLRVIGADGRGMKNLGYGCYPSWREDDQAVFYSSMDRPDAREGILHMHRLEEGTFDPLGLRGTGFVNQPGLTSIAYASTAYSRRNEAIWLLTATNKNPRLTAPTQTDHDIDPVYVGKQGMVVFTRIDDADGSVRLMSVQRYTQDRVATPMGQPAAVCYTRGGLWVGRNYPR